MFQYSYLNSYLNLSCLYTSTFRISSNQSSSLIITIDIITCIKSIDNIIKKNIKITNKTVNNLSSILVRFRLEAIPIEYSEKLLSMIGNTLEYDDCDENICTSNK